MASSMFKLAGRGCSVTNISIHPDAEYVEEIRKQAQESGNELALAALGVVDALVAGRQAIYKHYEKEKSLRLGYHSALSKARHWVDAPKPKGKKSRTKDDLEGVISLVRVEILTGLGELSDFEVTA